MESLSIYCGYVWEGVRIWVWLTIRAHYTLWHIVFRNVPRWARFSFRARRLGANILARFAGRQMVHTVPIMQPDKVFALQTPTQTATRSVRAPWSARLARFSIEEYYMWSLHCGAGMCSNRSESY
jgi:hypothetical protein